MTDEKKEVTNEITNEIKKILSPIEKIAETTNIENMKQEYNLSDDTYDKLKLIHEYLDSSVKLNFEDYYGRKIVANKFIPPNICEKFKDIFKLDSFLCVPFRSAYNSDYEEIIIYFGKKCTNIDDLKKERKINENNLNITNKLIKIPAELKSESLKRLLEINKNRTELEIETINDGIREKIEDLR